MFFQKMLNVKLCSQRHVYNQVQYLPGTSLVNVWLGSKYISGSFDAPCEMGPVNSFIFQYLIYVITSLTFVFENENIRLKNIWLLVLQDLHSFINTICIALLINIGMFKIKSNKKHF